MKWLKFGCKFSSKWLSFQSQSTEIQPYAWHVPTDQEAFINAVGAFIRKFQVEGWRIEVNRNLFLRATHMCTNGSIGEVHKLMTSAESLGSADKYLDMQKFVATFDKYFGNPGQINPFELSEISDADLHKQYREVLMNNSIIRSTRGGRTRTTSR